MKRICRQLLFEILPLVIGFIVQAFIHDEYQFTAVIILILFISLAIRYHEGEWTLFFIGLIIGFVVEVLSGLVFRMQHWENASLFGIPIWLPIFWGYGFIFIYRIGNLVVRRKPDVVH